MKRAFLLPLLFLPLLHAADSGLAQTPPMGWNSWNHFKSKVDDKVIRQVADAMATNGMRDAGYVYVNIDDTWEGERDANGVLQPNAKFPNMKALADYVHSKGLKLGIYSSPGPTTCAKFAGSYQHEEQDAKTWAAWGIDYLKYDWCSAGAIWPKADAKTQTEVYQKMGAALKNTGRPIVFSLCQYGSNKVWEWGPSVGGNLWRTTGDIDDTWISMEKIGFEKQTGLDRYAGPGHWNDPDMLEVGNGGMSDVEYRTHLTLWAMLAAPLIAGNDVRDMSPETKDILINKEVIAVDQDPLGKQAVRVSKDGPTEVWMKPLAGGDIAVACFNRSSSMIPVLAAFTDLQLQGKHKVRDLWAHRDMGSMKDHYAPEVSAHGVVLLRIH